MTIEAITSWLENPANLPDATTVQKVVKAYPWFVPGRVMEAAHNHAKTPFSGQVLESIRLHGSEWTRAYQIIDQSSRQVPVGATSNTHNAVAKTATDFVTEEETKNPAKAGEPVEKTSQHINEPLIQPLYTEDYFRHQGIDLPGEPKETPEKAEESAEPQTLMVVMSFSEWLQHFKVKSQKEQEEAREKSALRSMWQREKLAAALEDEPEEIPEDVFEMAVSSITKEDDIASESLAQIYEQQGKWSAAAEMYRKLALKYPAKSTYFASRAEAAKKRLL